MAFEEASSGKDPRLPEVMATTGPAAAARRLGYVSIEVIFLARASWYRPEWVSDIGRRLNDWWDVGQNGLLRWRLFGQEQIAGHRCPRPVIKLKFFEEIIPAIFPG